MLRRNSSSSLTFIGDVVGIQCPSDVQGPWGLTGRCSLQGVATQPSDRQSAARLGASTRSVSESSVVIIIIIIIIMAQSSRDTRHTIIIFYILIVLFVCFTLILLTSCHRKSYLSKNFRNNVQRLFYLQSFNRNIFSEVVLFRLDSTYYPNLLKYAGSKGHFIYQCL